LFPSGGTCLFVRKQASFFLRSQGQMLLLLYLRKHFYYFFLHSNPYFVCFCLFPFYSYYYKNKNKNPEAISQKVTKKLGEG
jgi:hypothetical protein